MQRIYQNIIQKKQADTKQFTKQLAVLIDPDKPEHLPQLLMMTAQARVDYFLVGGSLLANATDLDALVLNIKQQTDVPVILFPGSTAQITPNADGILLLSLISGRNADLLIGSHVQAAPTLKKSGLEIIPTGYMLIDGGKPTTATYISNTTPIPANKPEIAACTALAGEMLGLKLIYLDAGSGAHTAVSPEMVAAVRQQISLPIVVGGGITTPEMAKNLYKAGADIIVIGNVLEKNPELLKAFGALLY